MKRRSFVIHAGGVALEDALTLLSVRANI